MKLLDSNIIIYSAMPEHQDLKDLINSGNAAISAMTKIEVLGYHKITPEQITYFNAVFKTVKEYNIDKSVIDTAIKVRQDKNIKVGDAIIGATAIVHSLELVTRNVNDFKHLSNITITNPID